MSAKLRGHAALATAISLAVMLPFAVAGLVASNHANGAAAKQPKCGDTITTDTTLHKDLVDCPNNGILIGADDVTLDLNGHLIDGDGTPAAGCNPRNQLCDVGVGDEGHNRVTVMHGSVREFGIGAVAAKASHTRLLGISSSRNGGAGLGFDHVARSLLKNSSGSRNGAVGSFLVEGSHHVRILDSSFRHDGDHGILVADSIHNHIKGNLVAGNQAGITLEDADRNQVRGNRFGRNRESVLIGPGSRNVIARNRVSRTLAGIGIDKGRGNLVARNVVVHARRAGIRLGLQHPFIGGARNVVRRNVVRDSRVDGFLVGAKDRHSLLKRNVAKGAGDDGFDIESRTAKLTKNRAVRNHDLGIEAVRGVNDGGGNVARHNGDPRQCTHIACS
jgi:parallel beta-helix repeat protein